MNCSDCEDLIVDYAMDGLDGPQRQQVHAHLESGCGSCAASLAEIEATLARVPLSLDPVAPPARLKIQLMNRLNQDPDRSPAVMQPVRAVARPAAPAQVLRVNWVQPLLAGGLAAAITCGVFWGYIVSQQNELGKLRTEVARQEARLDQLQTGLDQNGSTLRLFSSPAVQLVGLQGAGDQTAAKGRAFWDTDRHSVHFFASGLKSLAANKAYELWFINAEQKKLPAGTFVVNDRGEASLISNPPADAGRVVALAVTDEPLGGSPQPTGNIQLIGQVQ